MSESSNDTSANGSAATLSPGMDRRARDASLAALARAKELGLAITVVVVDGSGALVTALRMDGAPWFTPDIARAKARTAVAFGMDSEDVEEWRVSRPHLVEQVSAQLPFLPATMPGGLVIRSGDQMVAGIGVSGASPAQDVECARAGGAAFG